MSGKNMWFGFQCWWERLTFRWKSFLDCFRFNHFKKFEEKWKNINDYPPSRDGYK